MQNALSKWLPHIISWHCLALLNSKGSLRKGLFSHWPRTYQVGWTGQPANPRPTCLCLPSAQITSACCDTQILPPPKMWFSGEQNVPSVENHWSREDWGSPVQRSRWWGQAFCQQPQGWAALRGSSSLTNVKALILPLQSNQGFHKVISTQVYAALRELCPSHYVFSYKRGYFPKPHYTAPLRVSTANI